MLLFGGFVIFLIFILITVIFSIVYWIYFDAKGGTPGKKFMKLKPVSLQREMSYSKAAVRNSSKIIGGFVGSFLFGNAILVFLVEALIVLIDVYLGVSNGEDPRRKYMDFRAETTVIRTDITEIFGPGPLAPPAPGSVPMAAIPRPTPPPTMYASPNMIQAPHPKVKRSPVLPLILVITVIGIIIAAIAVSAGIFLSEYESMIDERREVEMVETNIYHSQQTDTILMPGFGQIGGSSTTITYEFPVEDNASRATIITTDQGNNLRPDIDLYIYAPDGTEVASSAGATADEAVELDYKDFERNGFGQYTAEVRNFSNVAVTYEIVMDVYKMAPSNQTEGGR